MNEVLYRTANMNAAKQLLRMGMQPVRVDLVDDKYLVFSFPREAAALVAAAVPGNGRH